MALNLNFGGDNEYVSQAESARKSASGPSIIASILDAIGIGTQVAKQPDLSDSQTPEAKSAKQDKALAKANSESEESVSIPAISQAETALGVQPIPMAPMAVSTSPITPWGQQYLDSLKPLTQIDPDVGMLR
jgi:hypothetical protein